jgi:hypothetical protein
MDPRKKENNENENVKDQQARENKNIAEAHDQAERDIEQDADLSIHSPNDDLDEGESARLGENPNGIL